MLNVAELRRYGLLAALLVVGYLLVRAWNDDFTQKLPPAVTSSSPPTRALPPPNALPTLPGVVAAAVPPLASSVTTPVATPAANDSRSPLVEIATDVLQLWIDENGDVIKAALPG